MSFKIKVPKKLIEVALPLDAINVASAREKSIRHGHPSTMHLWWARRPLAAARAVIFAQMVNDPGFQHGDGFKYGKNKKEAAEERTRLFKIIEELVQWDNVTNKDVLDRAKAEMLRSWQEVCELNKDHPRSKELFDPTQFPSFHDPFAGGGTIPLEAQRLGLESYASDLNPVAVLLNKAMVEIPSHFKGRTPIGPIPRLENETRFTESNVFCAGLAEDVRRYGIWVREQAENRIGKFYPEIEITTSMVKERADLAGLSGRKLKCIALLWARTVKSPNPAFSHVDVPLASTFVLSQKDGAEYFIEPQISGDKINFEVKKGAVPASLKDGTKIARGANFQCLVSGSTISPEYIKTEGIAGRTGYRLLAIVAEADKGKVFLDPAPKLEKIALSAEGGWRPNTELPNDPRNFWTVSYGINNYGDLFTKRQLLSLTTFSDLINEVRSKVKSDAIAAGDMDEVAKLYADAIAVYLSCALGRAADYWSTNATWEPGGGFIAHAFTKQAIPMVWDFAEANPFSSGTGNWEQTALDWVVRVIINFAPSASGHACQADASKQEISLNKIISTDPPYYDNICYADLSEFFYSWMRRTLLPVYPDLFAGITVPKDQELVATPYRHGGKDKAELFFLDGMKKAMGKISEQAHPAFPITIYYAFKQSETRQGEGTSSTGWETFLAAVIDAGFALCGTWPLRTERANRTVGIGTNALASSILLVCKKRPSDATTISRREFIRELNLVLPEALEAMTNSTLNGQAPVAPVDLSQAIIGPGMEIFSKYSAVLEADGKTMPVRTALQLINRFLAQDDFDHDTQFCLSWFDGHGWDSGKFGEADVLARAKGTSVEGLKEGGVVSSSSGNLRLLKASELKDKWEPEADSRVSTWELLHYMIKGLQVDGEIGAAEILSKVSSYTESIRTLSYRLYTLCERKGWTQDAGYYNSLIIAWEAIETAAQIAGYSGAQLSMLGEDISTSEKSLKKGKRKKHDI